MKTIAFFNSIKSWGGGEKWYYETALYFHNSGYTVHFFLDENGELYKKLKVFSKIQLHFINVSGLSFLNPFKVTSLKNEFKHFGIEIIFINLSHDLKLAGQAASRSLVSRIIYTRAIPVPIKNSALNRYIFSHWVTDILANSHATAASILRNNQHLFSKEKIRVIYNSLDADEFCMRAFRLIYSRQDHEIVIGNLGRLEKEKNHLFLISVSEHLLKKEIPHKILIGGKGSMEKELKAIVNAKGLNNYFIFSGFLSNVKDLLMSCDIFMLPSFWEVFGFVIVESFLCKKPVIAFNTSSIPELIIDNKTVFIIKLNDIESCVNKIIILKTNPKKMIEMGENGFNYVCKNFDKKEIMHQLEIYINRKT